jgi:hypothetical protein
MRRRIWGDARMKLMAIPSEALERHRRCLGLFVVRARRVEAHSLAADKDELHRLATGNFDVTMDAETGDATLRRSFPPEEEVESAAARVRPFILEKDPIHHAKVTGALGAFTGANTVALAEVAKAKRWWKEIDPRSERVRGYGLQRTTLDGHSDYVSDNVLAFGWIYGDTIHADERSLIRTAPFDVDDRFRAAVPLVAGIMIRVLGMLRMVEQFIKAGLVELPAEVFTMPVVSTERALVEQAVVLTAPAGTRPPLSGEELGPEWQPLRPERMPDIT